MNIMVKLTWGIVLTSFLGLGGCGGGGSGTTAQPDLGNGNNGDGTAAVPVADVFNWTGDVRLQVLEANGLLANDPATALIASADTLTSLGGVVAVDKATGAFTYDPPVGAQNTDDSFSYSLDGGGAATVTISLNERVWFVRNDDTGADLGTDQAPFRTLLQAQNASDAGDTIFVFAGDRTDRGQDRGIVLKDGQKLIGEGDGLMVNGFPIVDPLPRALISNSALGTGAGNTPVVMLGSGNEVAGFDIQPSFNEGVLALGGAAHLIRDNIIGNFGPAEGREGIRLLNVSGNNAVTRNRITGALRDGIKISNVEDEAGTTVAATQVTGSLLVNLNTVSTSDRSAIALILGGTGTDVSVSILNNGATDSGGGGIDEGIDVQAQGAAVLKVHISRNSISGSTDESIELLADGDATLNSFVANNSLTRTGLHFRATVENASSASQCLELFNNSNATRSLPGDSSFRVENSAGLAGEFILFEAANDNTAQTIGTITLPLQGACAVPLDGAALFETNCGHCHQGNAMGRGTIGPDVTNQTLVNLNFQIANNFSMANINLTTQEKQAIIDALQAAP